jgi:hypothetical protein
MKRREKMRCGYFTTSFIKNNIYSGRMFDMSAADGYTGFDNN